MQKQLSYLDVFLEDDFPISYYKYEQGHHDLNKLHYHNALEIGLCLSGTGLFFINNKIVSFKQNDISIIFPKQAHIAQSPDEFPSVWYFLTVDIDKLVSLQSIGLPHLSLLQDQLPCILSKSENKDIFDLVHMIISELENREINYKEVITQLLSAFLLKLVRLKVNTLSLNNHFSITSFNTIYPALDYISTFYSQDISIEKLASLCHLSCTHFSRIFKKVTHHSPYQYLVYVRMHMAKTLLKSTDLSIILVAQNVGYSSITCFNRTFKNFFGITPTQYKNL